MIKTLEEKKRTFSQSIHISTENLHTKEHHHILRYSNEEVPECIYYLGLCFLFSILFNELFNLFQGRIHVHDHSRQFW